MPTSRTAAIEPRFSLGRLMVVIAIAAVALALAPPRARALAAMPPLIAALAMLLCSRQEFQLVAVVLLLLTCLIFPGIDPQHFLRSGGATGATGPSRALRPIPPLPRPGGLAGEPVRGTHPTTIRRSADPDGPPP